jgi:hypothetical protein
LPSIYRRAVENAIFGLYPVRVSEYTPLPAALNKTSRALPAIGRDARSHFGAAAAALAFALVGGALWMNQAPRPMAANDSSAVRLEAPQAESVAAPAMAENRAESPAPLNGSLGSLEAPTASRDQSSVPEPPTAAGEASVSAASGLLGGDAGGFVSWRNKDAVRASVPIFPAKAEPQGCGGVPVLWQGGGPQHVIVSAHVYGKDRTPASNIQRILPCGIMVLNRAPTAEESLPPLTDSELAKTSASKTPATGPAQAQKAAAAPALAAATKRIGPQTPH